MAHETVPADIAAAIAFLAEKCLFAGRFADAALIERSIKEGRAPLEAVILKHLRNADEMKAALQLIEQGV